MLGMVMLLFTMLFLIMCYKLILKIPYYIYIHLKHILTRHIKRSIHLLLRIAGFESPT